MIILRGNRWKNRKLSLCVSPLDRRKEVLSYSRGRGGKNMMRYFPTNSESYHAFETQYTVIR